MENISLARALGLRVKLSAPLTCWNDGQVEEMLDLAEANGLQLQIDPDITPRDDGDTAPTALALDEAGLKQFTETIERRARTKTAGGDVGSQDEATSPKTPVPDVVSRKHCGAGSSTIAVGPYGTVYPSVQYRQPIGNLHEQSVKVIWETSSALREVRDEVVKVKEWRDSLGEGEGRWPFAREPPASRPAARRPSTPSQGSASAWRRGRRTSARCRGRSHELIGPRGQATLTAFPGGLGEHSSAFASSSSLNRTRGAS